MLELIGKTIGEIQLIEKIAESDQTLVIMGFRSEANSYLTVAVLQPQGAADTATIQRFLQAAQLAA